MTGTAADITVIAHVIQTAIAPVFMLAGISSFLGVLSTRLGRIIDRSIEFNRALTKTELAEHHPLIQVEIKRLMKRARLMNTAIIFGTSSAILICLVIIVLFLGNFLSLHLALIVTFLFVTCMICLSSAFTFFLIEVSFAINYMRDINVKNTQSFIYLSK